MSFELFVIIIFLFAPNFLHFFLYKIDLFQKLEKDALVPPQ